MIVVTRFRVGAAEAETFRTALEQAHAVLAEQRGFLDGQLGRNVDDPDLWLLQTRWESVGAYRRALSAYDVKLHAWTLLGQAVDEPSAYEVIRPGEESNRVEPREIR